MATFSLKNGDLKKIIEPSPLSAADMAWLSSQIEGCGDILPEKLLAISSWGEPGGVNGLLALDKAGSLAIIVMSNQSPPSEWIEEAAELAWQQRYAEYSDLGLMARDYSESRVWVENESSPPPDLPHQGGGIVSSSSDSTSCDMLNFKKTNLEGENLATRHRNFFGYDGEHKETWFNRNQRLIVLAPDFSRSIIDKLSLRKFEIDIKAYRFQFIDLDSNDRLLSIQTIDSLEKSKTAALLSCLTSAPSTFRENPSDQNEEETDQEPASTASGVTARITGTINKLGISTRALEYITLVAMIGLYIGTFSFLSIRNHNNYGTFGFDLGIYDQAIWLLSQLKDPFITVKGLHIFADQLPLILALFAPIYLIWDDVRLLLVLQTVILAMGALPIYLMAKEKLGNSALSISLAASYLLYPALQWLNSDQFHPESVATTCLLFALYFALKQSHIPFAVFSILAAFSSSNMSLTLILLGLFVAATGNRRVGFITSGLSLIWFIVGLKLIHPHFNTEIPGLSDNLYPNLTTIDAINSLLADPSKTLLTVMHKGKLIYLVQLLAPLAFLPLAGIEIIAISSPDLLSNLVNQRGYMDSIHYHYTAAIIPFVFASSIIGIKKLSLNQKGMSSLAFVIVAIALISNHLLSPSPISQNFSQGYWNIKDNYKRNMEAALSLIPEDASVSAIYYIVPHLSHREKIYEFPNPFITANWGYVGENTHDKESIEYIAVDLSNLPHEQRLLIEKLRNKDFKQIFEKDGVLILKRKH